MFMKKEQKLVVIAKTYDLILWSCNHASRIRKVSTVTSPTLGTLCSTAASATA